MCEQTKPLTCEHIDREALIRFWIKNCGHPRVMVKGFLGDDYEYWTSKGIMNGPGGITDRGEAMIDEIVLDLDGFISDWKNYVIAQVPYNQPPWTKA